MERRSGLRPCEKELPERRSGTNVSLHIYAVSNMILLRY
jgi:hypothetical protein